MVYYNKIQEKPPALPILGRTLPSLLDEVCEGANINPRAVNQWTEKGWKSLSSQALREQGEDLALGLQQRGLTKGDKVAFLMHSDVNFVLADMACLLAGLVDVPIDLTQTLDNIVFILQHSEAKALIVSDLDLLAQVVPYLWDTPNLHTVIVADVADNWEQKRAELLTCSTDTHPIEQVKLSHPACLCIPMLLCQAHEDRVCPQIPHCIEPFSLSEIQIWGKQVRTPVSCQQLRGNIFPQDLATIIYIAGETGKPRGVMLSHENISADILTTFKVIPDFKPGTKETILSFLPLTHIFARAQIYGHLNYGHSVYFTNPNRAIKDFPLVRPTIVATVPRLLEKVYQKIIDRGNRLRGTKKIIFNWALKLAQSYELGKKPKLSQLLPLKLADILVFSQIRRPFGGRLKYFISGGAALRGDIANILSGTGMTVLQGYGLTETSSVVCCNRSNLNRAGTVGLPIPGVQLRLAPDKEILVKAPYVMQGYYQDSQATAAVIDQEGWLHTGDLGEFTAEGFLVITGTKKDLFKLSTGKYVTPEPLERQVQTSPLVKHAVAVGAQKKFCGMLIFPDLERLSEQAKALGLYLPKRELLHQPEIIALYQQLVDDANQKLPSWSRVKGFRLVEGSLTVENGLLQPNLKINRAKVNQVFATEIEALYKEPELQPAPAIPIESWFKRLTRRIQREFKLSRRFLAREFTNFLAERLPAKDLPEEDSISPELQEKEVM